MILQLHFFLDINITERKHLRARDQSKNPPNQVKH